MITNDHFPSNPDDTILPVLKYMLDTTNPVPPHYNQRRANYAQRLRNLITSLSGFISLTLGKIVIFGLGIALPILMALTLMEEVKTLPSCVDCVRIGYFYYENYGFFLAAVTAGIGVMVLIMTIHAIITAPRQNRAG
jgi:hypothetical protein